MGAWATHAAGGEIEAEGSVEIGGMGAVEVEEAAPLLASIVKAAGLSGPVPTPAMCRVALRLDHGARAVACSNAPLGRQTPQQKLLCLFRARPRQLWAASHSQEVRPLAVRSSLLSYPVITPLAVQAPC